MRDAEKLWHQAEPGPRRWGDRMVPTHQRQVGIHIIPATVLEAFRDAMRAQVVNPRQFSYGKAIEILMDHWAESPPTEDWVRAWRSRVPVKGRLPIALHNLRQRGLDAERVNTLLDLYACATTTAYREACAEARLWLDKRGL